MQYHNHPLFIGIIIASTFIIISCGILLIHAPNNADLGNGKPVALCTTSMLADAVRTVGGSHVTVHSLMGPGVDPHIYRAREHDVHALADADIIFYNGLHLEGKMSLLLEHLSAYKPVVAVGNAIPEHLLIQSPDFPEVYDPHIWFNVQLWIRVIGVIAEALSNVDPIHKVDYQDNAHTYILQLNQLHQYIIDRASSLDPAQRILVTAHDAFGYFGKAYGFKVVGLQGISTESEASMYDIEQLVAFIIAHQIPAIFIEASLPRRTIEAVQQAAHAHAIRITIEPELYSDTLGTPGTPPGTYIGMVKHNIDAIVAALQTGPARI
jgi:manganese/zinc/iron transport system substrate-binding protein